jgi:hypothetical protein
MMTVFVSIAVGVLTFSFGMLGLYLRRLLPEKHMSTGSEKMIGAIMGLECFQVSTRQAPRPLPLDHSPSRARSS